MGIDVAADPVDHVRHAVIRGLVRTTTATGTESGALRLCGAAEECHLVALGPAGRAGRAAKNARVPDSVQEFAVETRVVVEDRAPEFVVIGGDCRVHELTVRHELTAYY